ncbi:ornithine cyclodeaminase family protein [Runella slithyformis]|uniref:Ornithine cyclodeaminase n=1 Tax=Runella slithyformis (strain ATCC 29530 / DSM 19594 / LMG 11500 / NCIMB 11436 / LSU 4) TaxID=761193 RepID=A0A7U3ZMX8_RUNSL|nr:ornithine cyclodeaminase [Runella slithyformis]AEI50166.1 Ornithine cyclodeaminase [Runella slithyformis DSM 19594]
MHTFRYFSRQAVEEGVTMIEAIELMKEAFRSLSRGEAVVPLRINLSQTAQNAQTLFMPVYLPSAEALGVKMVTVFRDNPIQNLPLIHGLMLVMDGTNGQPLALLDAEYLTALRTGAASGLATDLLARKEAKVLAVFGTGAQARTQTEGVAAVRTLEKVLVFGRNLETADAFCHEMRIKTGLPMEVAQQPERLLEADIICTATTSNVPVFEHRHLKKGVHINGVGSYRPETRELPGETMQAARITVDQRTAAAAEAGDILLPMNDGMLGEAPIFTELGEIVAGIKSGRRSDDEITVFKSVGNAAQDLAVASYLVKKAEEYNLGTVLG